MYIQVKIHPMKLLNQLAKSKGTFMFCTLLNFFKKDVKVYAVVVLAPGLICYLSKLNNFDLKMATRISGSKYKLDEKLIEIITKEDAILKMISGEITKDGKNYVRFVEIPDRLRQVLKYHYIANVI